MHSKQKIIVERRSLEGQDGARVSLRLVDTLDELSSASLTFTLGNRTDAPVNECQFSLIRSSPESRSALVHVEEYTRESKLSALLTEYID